MTKVTGGAQDPGLVCARALLEHVVFHLAIIGVDSEQATAAVEHLHKFNADGEYTVGFWNIVTQENALNEQIDIISGSIWRY